VALASCHIIN